MRAPPCLRPALLLPLSAVLLAASGVAQAASSPADVAAAQTLFDEAKALMQAGRYEPACAKLEESQRLDPGPGTEFHLGECYAKLGRTASAWATFSGLADEMHAAGKRDREHVARTHAAALEPKLAKLDVVVPEAVRVPGLELRRDGEVIRDVLWGSAIPVDPGAHVVTASAPQHEPWKATVETTGEGKTTTLTVPRLAEVAVAAVTAPSPPAGGGPEPDPSSAPDVRPGGSTQRAIGVVTACLGVAAMGVGSYFGVTAISKHDDYASHCTGSACDATGVQLHDQSVTAGNLSTAFFIGGGVAMAAGAVLWFTAPATTTTIGLGPTGVFARRTW